MTIREFAKLNNFPIKGKLTRIPDEVEYDFNDRPHNCKRYVDEDFNEYGIHTCWPQKLPANWQGRRFRPRSGHAPPAPSSGRSR